MSESSGSGSEVLNRPGLQLEDQAKLLTTISLHSLYSDIGPIEQWLELYSDDCVVDLGDLLPAPSNYAEGRAQLRDRILLHPVHDTSVGTLLHYGPGVRLIKIEGDEGSIVAYGMTVRGSEKPYIDVLTLTLWKFRRVDGVWRIILRLIRRLGAADIPAIFGPYVAAARDEIETPTF
jgi:hypothetical protein